METNHDYHGDVTRISKSGLDTINDCPRNYWYQKFSGEYVREEKSHFDLGSALHTAVLEPHLLDKEYFTLDETKILEDIGGKSPRSTNRYRDWKSEQLAANNGRTVIAVADWDQINRAKDAIHSHSEFKELFAVGGFKEQTVLWTEPETGAKCKIRPDFKTHDRVILDLKSARSAKKADFAKSIANYRYHVQDAFYSDGMFYGTGEQVVDFVFAVVELTPPYNCGLYRLSDTDRSLGRELYMRDLEAYLECIRTGNWRTYNDETETISLPNWARVIPAR